MMGVRERWSPSFVLGKSGQDTCKDWTPAAPLWSCGGGTGKSHTHGRGMWDAAKRAGRGTVSKERLTARRLLCQQRLCTWLWGPWKQTGASKGITEHQGSEQRTALPCHLAGPTGPPQTSSTTESLQTKGKFTTAVKRKDWLPCGCVILGGKATNGPLGQIFCFG